MVITKLVLFRYNRLFLNNIEKVTYTPKEIVQIILGENGSGKSSIMKELSFLPANISKEYSEGGYKHIEGEHNGKSYVATSGVVSRTKHSFVVDGQELNAGGTKRVQLSLVKEHFGITPAIMKILVGTVNFTTMSIMERKRWFTEMSNLDYTFAIDMFNKLRSNHRDTIGGIKLLQDNIIQLESVVNEKIDIKELDKEIGVIKEHIEYALKNYDTNITNVVDLETDIKNLENSTKRLIAMGSMLDSMQTIDSRNIENKLEILESKINTLKETLKVKQDLAIKLNTNTVDIDIIKNDIKELQHRMMDLQSKNDIGIDLSNVDIIANNFSYIQSDVISLILELLEYKHINVDEFDLNSLKVKRDTLTKELRYNENLLSKIQGEIEIQKSLVTDDNKVTCNSCGHQFYFKYDKSSHTNNLSKVDQIVNIINKLEENYKKVNNTISIIETKNQIREKLRKLTSSDKQLVPLWVSVFTKHKVDSETVITAINELGIKLEELKKHKEHNKKVTELESILKIEEEKDKLRKEHSINKESLDSEITSIITDINKLNIEYAKFQNLGKVVNEFSSEYEGVKRSIKKINKNRKENVVVVKNTYLTKVVSMLKEKLMQVEEKKSLHNESVNKLLDYKKQLVGLKEKEKALKVLTEEMSPSKGLIAKSINSFLNVFVSNMNRVINSIWSYKIELLPCEIEEKDLDYKFKVKVNDSGSSPDVSELSTSMMDVVNLAFRIVFSKFMHLDSLPIYLDEFGSTFDAQHRINAYNIIDSIMGNTYNQIFIISHFKSMYGRFVNADVNVVSNKNVDLSEIDKYNSNFILE